MNSWGGAIFVKLQFAFDAAWQKDVVAGRADELGSVEYFRVRDAFLELVTQYCNGDVFRILRDEGPPASVGFSVPSPRH